MPSNISRDRRRGHARGSRSGRFSDKSSFRRPWLRRRGGGQSDGAGLLVGVAGLAEGGGGELRQDNVFRYVVAAKGD
jgi:hypothetical protein